jgi:hypothetical protein
MEGKAAAFRDPLEDLADAALVEVLTPATREHELNRLRGLSYCFSLACGVKVLE